MNNAYALIKSFCNITMINKIEAHPDFETKIRDNAIELLKVIKVLMHDPERARYPYASLTDAMSRLINIKQYESETLIDYTKHFKQARDIYESHIGKDILDTFVTHTKEYKESTTTLEKEALKAGAFSKWMGYIFIHNSDPKRYGSLVTNLSSQFSMEVNQYPKTVNIAVDILNQHKYDSG